MKESRFEMPVKYDTDKDRMDVVAVCIESALELLGLNISIKTSIKNVSGKDWIEFLFAERIIKMDIKDRITREWLEARRRDFTFNSVLLGKKEIEELKASEDKFDEESIEDWRKTTIKMVPIDEKEYLSIANILDINEPAHTLNLKREELK